MRRKSKFNYPTAGGKYMPTYNQYYFCTIYKSPSLSIDEKEAIDKVIYGFLCKKKIHHDYIHIVNELRKNRFI